LLKSGRLSKAIRPDGLIDFQEADRLWTPAGQIPQIVVDPSSAAAGGGVTVYGEPQPHGGWLKRSQADDEPDDPNGAALLDAKTRLEAAKAEMAELKLAKQRGELVEVGEARKTWHAIGRMFAQARENVPKQLAPLLAGKTDLLEIEKLVRIAYRDADGRVADEIASRFGALVGNESDDGGAGQ
jgi:hypothetical protein